MLETQKYVLSEVKRRKVCAPWLRSYLSHANSGDELARMYVDGINWCINTGFPTIEDLKSRVPLESLHDAGVWLDETIGVAGKKVVARGNSRGSLFYGDNQIANVYLLEGAAASIHAAGRSFVTVDIFADSRATVAVSGEAFALVQLFTGGTLERHEIAGSGRIKVVRRGTANYAGGK